MIRFLYCRNGHIVDGSEIAKVSSFLAEPDAKLWVDIQWESPQEVQWLEQTFRFHPLTIEDCTHRNQRPKVDDYDDYFFVVLHSSILHHPEKEVDTQETHFFVASNYLVTVRNDKTPQLDFVYQRYKHETALWTRGIDFLFYRISDALMDSYFPILDKIEDHIDQLEDHILAGPNEDTLKQLFVLKRDLTLLRKTVSPLRDAFNILGRGDVSPVSEKTAIYFRDIHNHLTRATELINSYRDMVGGALDIYLTTISNRMNGIMKRLAAVATIFLPLSFLAGFFGMNFQVIPYGNPVLFTLSILLFIGLPVIMAWWFYRKQWF
jgi:magnesium transporter